MRERPIPFSPPMARAVRAGIKTQTRREATEFGSRDDLEAILKRFPNQQGRRYGQPGDRLWVREPWRTTGDGGRADYLPPRDLQPHEVWYEADGQAPADFCVGKLRPGMFMPRWACRIQLEITRVWVERLQDISDVDALAEGCSHSEMRHGDRLANVYARLWDKINGAGSWAANPWVWVVEFKDMGPPTKPIEAWRREWAAVRATSKKET